MLIRDERTARQALQCVRESEHVVFDLETTGLSCFHGARIAGVAVQVHGLRGYFPFRHAEGNLPPDLLLPLLAAVWTPGKTVTGHNVQRFDVQHTVHENPHEFGRLLLPGNGVTVRDTMIAALLDNENVESFKLEALAERHGIPDPWAMSHALDAELKARKLKKDSMWRLPPEKVAPYACADVRLAGALDTSLTRNLAWQELTGLLQPMCEYARLLARMERRGLLMDADRLRGNAGIAAGLATSLLAEIREAAGSEALNPRSPKQLSAWLGIPSTAKKVLKQMNHPHAKLLTRYRCAEKAGGTYYQPILDLLDEHGVLHPQLNLTRDPSDVGGTRSGRLSCSKPNFQALPKTDDIYRVRECVIARPGYVILSCDYERAEVWMAGSFCGDPAIEAAYYQDVDLYEGLAAELKVTRDQAKIVFLAIQYGVGAWKLGLMLGIPEEAARGIIHDFRRSYPRIARAMYAHAQEAEETGEITLFTGRKAHFDGEVSTFYSGWNRRVQGSVGEMMRLTQQALESPLDSYGAHMLLQVHDELMVECPVENVRPVAALVQAVATSFDEFALRPRISIGVGANYEDAKKAA